MITVVTDDVPLVSGDRVELQQVLLNLVGNSIDAMEGIDTNSRVIEIASSFSPDSAVKVSVRDTGVGLAGVDRKRMFALAYTTKPSGSGVGLSISRSIVEAHGGRLWAEEATHGAHLLLHSSHPFDSERPPSSERQLKAEPRGSRQRGMRVDIIDAFIGFTRQARSIEVIDIRNVGVEDIEDLDDHACLARTADTRLLRSTAWCSST